MNSRLSLLNGDRGIFAPADESPAWTPGLTALLVFTLAHLSAAGLWAAAHGAQEFLFYLSLAPAGLATMVWLQLRLRFHPGLLWCLSFLAILHMMGGLIPAPAGWTTEDPHRLYDVWLVPNLLKYDNIIHTFGNGLATWACWHLIQRAVTGTPEQGFRNKLRPTVPLLCVCVLAGMGVGSLHEIMEFITTHFVENHGVGGYQNTLMDLVADTFGSLVAAGLLWSYGKRTCADGRGLMCRGNA